MKAKARVLIAMGKQGMEMVLGGYHSIPLRGIFGIMGCGGIDPKVKSFGSLNTGHPGQG
jgi:hypothetical protein